MHLLSQALAHRARLEGLTPHQRAFTTLLAGAAILAGVIHLCFMGLMLWAGVDALALGNVLSVTAYTSMWYLARIGRPFPALMLGATEVAVHAVAAVWLIGWDSGFHYYLLLIMPVAMLSSVTPRQYKLPSVALLAAIYLVLDALCRQRVPGHVLEPAVLGYLHYFNVVGLLIILAFLAAFYEHQIVRTESSLKRMATTDELTGLSNRRALSAAIELEHARVLRGQHPLAFLMADIDHFKGVNDRYGHQAGDGALKAVSEVLAKGVREVDHLGRWGGEEFLMVLPGAGEGDAALVADRLRRQVAALRLSAGDEQFSLTITFGVSEMRPGETAEQALQRVDRALYAGKNAGRDRVFRASSLPAER